MWKHDIHKIILTLSRRPIKWTCIIASAQLTDVIMLKSIPNSSGLQILTTRTTSVRCNVDCHATIHIWSFIFENAYYLSLLLANLCLEGQLSSGQTNVSTRKKNATEQFHVEGSHLVCTNQCYKHICQTIIRKMCCCTKSLLWAVLLNYIRTVSSFIWPIYVPSFNGHSWFQRRAMKTICWKDI